MTECAVIALGGNAILGPQEKGTGEEQLLNLAATAKSIIEIVQTGVRVVITHGNGPQIGAILLQNEAGKKDVPSMPIDICVAESQGLLGYLIEHSLRNEAQSRNLSADFVTILTQAVVRRDDPDFSNPSKPIGPFYTATNARRLSRERGYIMMEDAGRGWRRVVPSPQPIRIVEAEAIRRLTREGVVVIACGGGGIPIVGDGTLRGVEAVIDKDLASRVLASQIGATVLMLLTDVRKVCLNYGSDREIPLNSMDSTEARKYLGEGHFRRGSMEPKVRAAVEFVEKGGKFACIASLDDAFAALNGKAGTRITLAE